MWEADARRPGPLGGPRCLPDALSCLEWQLGTQRAVVCPGSHLLPGALTKGWASPLDGVGDSLSHREPVSHSLRRHGPSRAQVFTLLPVYLSLGSVGTRLLLPVERVNNVVFVASLCVIVCLPEEGVLLCFLSTVRKLQTLLQHRVCLRQQGSGAQPGTRPQEGAQADVLALSLRAARGDSRLASSWPLLSFSLLLLAPHFVLPQPSCFLPTTASSLR